MASPIILYDGVCGLCNRFVRFVLRRDRAGTFRFASLQSPLAARILSRHGSSATELDTVCVVMNPDEAHESVLLRSEAILYILEQLGGISRASAHVFHLVPPSIRDCAYRILARNRYRIFGRDDACPLPDAQTRSRFLDV